MTEPTTPEAATPPALPTILIRLLPNGAPQVSLPKGMDRAMANLLLDHAKMLVLSQPTDAEQAKLVQPNGIAGLMKRAGL